MEVQRKKIYDPAFEEFVDEELPTVSVKDAARKDIHGSSGTVLLRKALGGGTVMRLTFQRVSANTGAEFYLEDDLSGTFDYIHYPGTHVAPITDIGEPEAPVHVVKGTFTMGLIGSFAPGTYYAAYEGVVRFQGTETRS